MNAYLDAAVMRCPKCGKVYVDASWYLIELESDIQCNVCGTEFNSKNNTTDRVLLEFEVDEKGKMQNVKVAKHFPTEQTGYDYIKQ